MISVRPEPLMVPDPLNDSIAAILAAEADPLIVDSKLTGSVSRSLMA